MINHVKEEYSCDINDGLSDEYATRNLIAIAFM